MRPGDRYHKWVEWSEADGVYIGRCPDVITGIHGQDPAVLYRELCDTVDDVLRHLESEGRGLPVPRVKPMQEVA
ncbi:MAG: pilus assembly protein HicB [Lentisphaerae bacterium RIFOXYB12_FULL_65_16]|nr:MAG: pilus assembly protein HicB [Lentisphaerae bacterium RIFOXYA12_64_32]OGV85079.1 MAG: pilus assembly protein HicB [Lentisphaerae bacterium RIFOXYB12_FULL_65_16]